MERWCNMLLRDGSRNANADPAQVVAFTKCRMKKVAIMNKKWQENFPFTRIPEKALIFAGGVKCFVSICYNYIALSCTTINFSLQVYKKNQCKIYQNV